MNPNRVLFIACATALLAASPTSLLAQWNTRPLAPVPPVMNASPAGVTGPVTTFQAGAQPGTTFVQPGTQFTQPGAASLPPTVIAPPVITAQPNAQFVQPGTQFVQPGTQFAQPGAPVVMGPNNIPNMPAPPPGGFGAGFDPYYQPLPGSPPPAASLGAPLLPGGTNWNSFGSTTGITPRAGGGTQFGDDVGLSSDMSWFHGFIPVFQTPGQSIWFVETRGIKYHQNGGAYGFNFETGYRWFSPTTNRVNGFYGGYDYRNLGTGFDVDQIAVGVESLGPVWDFRANGYLLLSSETQFVNFTNLAYTGTNLAGTANFIDAFSGIDAEVGRNFAAAGPSFDLRIFGGGYGFTSQDSQDAWGVRGRIEAVWWNQVSVGASVQHDQLFGTTAYLTFAALLGGPNRGNPCACPTIADRLGDPLHKNMHVVVNQRAQDNTVILDPTDNLPLEFLHIDSNAAAGGTGTFEAPLDALANAPAGTDIVLLHAGSVFIDQSITIDDAGQRLLGDSATVPHTAESQFGTITLPRANALATKPILSGLLNGSAVVVSANDVEVSGLDIQSPDDHGIAVGSFTGFDINRNMILGADANDGSVGEGIFVNVGALVDVDGTISQNMITGGNNSGIRIAGAGSFAGTIANNAFNGNNDHGMFMQSDVSGGTITGNTAAGNGLDGFRFAANVSGGTISNNTANTNGNLGFNFLGTVSGAATMITGNTAAGNGTAGAFDGFFFNDIDNGLIDSNFASMNTQDGFDLNNAFTGGTFSNNVSNNNTVDGFNGLGGVGGTAINNTATGNGGSNANFPP